MHYRNAHKEIVCTLILAAAAATATEMPHTPGETSIPPATTRNAVTLPLAYTDKTEFTISETPAGLTIIEFIGTSTEVFIPENMDGKPVIAIGESAFASTAIVTVRIPGTVKSIGKDAFTYCDNLKVAELQPGVETMAEQAFGFCPLLERISLPATLTSIGVNTFTDCPKLSTIQLDPTSQHFMVNRGILFDFGQTEAIKAAASLVTADSLPATLRHIRKAAFQHCPSLNSVTLPEGLQTVGDFAFFDSGLTSLTVPASVQNLGFHAFYQCKGLARETVTFNAILPPIGTENAFDFQVLDYAPASDFTFTEIAGGKAITAYQGTASTLLIPPAVDGQPVLAIANSAFNGNQTIQHLLVPSSVTTVEAYAFMHCAKLQTVRLQEGIDTLGEGSFGFCPMLTEIHLPKSLRTIGPEAFTDCPSLTILDLSPDSRSFKLINGVLLNYGGNQLIKVPAKLEATTFTVPEGVTDIADTAFDACRDLTHVTLPKTLESIGVYAFKNCSGLTRMIIPETITQISHHAFINCTALTTLCIKCSPKQLEKVNEIIPGSVTKLYTYQKFMALWKELYPELMVLPLDAPENLSITIQGTQNIMANDGAFFRLKAYNTVDGEPLEVPFITWQLDQAPKGTTITPEGRLILGDCQVSAPFQVQALIQLGPTTPKQLITLPVNAMAPGTTVMPLVLSQGWNLVAPTFHLDQKTADQLLTLNPFGYDAAIACYYRINSFSPGVPFWIYSHEDMTITMTGSQD